MSDTTGAQANFQISIKALRHIGHLVYSWIRGTFWLVNWIRGIAEPSVVIVTEKYSADWRNLLEAAIAPQLSDITLPVAHSGAHLVKRRRSSFRMI